MSILTEAEKIARYDAQRDGSLYIKPEPAGKDASGAVWDEIIDVITSDPWEPVLAITDDPTDDGREHDTPLSDLELRALDILFPSTVVVPSRNETHRQQRWDAIIDQIAAMDEPQQSETIEYVLGVLEQIKGK